MEVETIPINDAYLQEEELRLESNTGHKARVILSIHTLSLVVTVSCLQIDLIMFDA